MRNTHHRFSDTGREHRLRPYVTGDHELHFDPAPLGELPEESPEEIAREVQVWKSQFKRRLSEKQAKRDRRAWSLGAALFGTVVALIVALCAWAIWH